MPQYPDLGEYEVGHNPAASYCFRCQRGFKTKCGLSLHIHDSRRHWECPTCSYDAQGWDELLDHCRQTNCRSVCQGCHDGRGKHWPYSSVEYWDHIQDHHVCGKCEEHVHTSLVFHCHICPGFASPGGWEAEDEGYGDDWNEEEYDDAYDDDDCSNGEECLMCGSWFSTYGGMILHLESGTCWPVNRTTLDTHAARCNWSSHYMNPQSCNLARHGYGLDVNFYNYYCPDCKTPATRLSGLMQHVESGCCKQTLGDGAIGALCAFLETCL
ncbi:hypothetical protein E8E13_005462 [Curvularia kusanoi]|uniref:Uncharacterized protein n=1 Tax=Curvularia kusanoi TaxID=90978 RepID=A0A9P4T7K4_CURKU|nr:hypothetical protein E8E13_005462 [Curvularia kusanoi]